MNITHPFGERRGLEVVYPVDIPPRVKVAAGRLIVANIPFGDPMTAVRIDRQKRWLLFDIGSFAQIPARTAHQVSDIFISHFHVDHVCGFPWLLGRRVNCPEICRVYGPPGLAHHFDAMTRCFTWDRVGEQGPRFSIAEYHNDHLQWWHYTIGTDIHVQPGSPTPVQDGILLEDPLFQVRTTILDHGIPVMAYSMTERPNYQIQSERIATLGLDRGVWIADLQKAVNAGAWHDLIQLPNGRLESVQLLAQQLVQETPGQKIVYATDFADTTANRSTLIDFAQRADILVCETSYLAEDQDHAQRTSHATTRAAAEIAKDADVSRLLPFHFSNRYVDEPERLYREMAAIFPHLEVPLELRHAL